jgi:hypothetical protein
VYQFYIVEQDISLPNGILSGMPLTRREVFQLGLLLLCVPAQYYLSAFYQGDTSIELRQQTVHNVVNEIRHLKDTWLNIRSWKAKYMQFIVWLVKGEKI